MQIKTKQKQKQKQWKTTKTKENQYQKDLDMQEISFIQRAEGSCLAQYIPNTWNAILIYAKR